MHYFPNEKQWIGKDYVKLIAIAVMDAKNSLKLYQLSRVKLRSFLEILLLLWLLRVAMIDLYWKKMYTFSVCMYMHMYVRSVFIQ